MKTYPDNYAEFESAPAKEPRYVVKISWDDADSDFTYLTSSADAEVPAESPPVDRIDNAVLSVSGQTQKINPDIATSTIGAVTINLSDVTDNSASPPLTNQITTRINTKLISGDGLRGKIVRVYVGYDGMLFSAYDLRLTYIVDSISYKDGIYKIKTSDVQRIQRHKIFTPDETQLNISIDATTLIIPVVSIDTALFPAVTHGNEWSVDPGVSVAYIKIDDEVIRHQGGISFDTTNGWHITALERSVFNTLPASHDVDSGTEDKRKPKITEHIYIEGPAPKVIYAILTGELLNGASPEDTLPSHWHLGIDTAFVRLSDFQNIGLYLWNTSDDTGKPVRIENPNTQDGKRYIEKEMLLWMGCFMPIYSTGEIGLKNLTGVLSDSAWSMILDKFNITSYSELTHNMRAVINDIRLKWNWVDVKGEFTKESIYIDSDSITKHGVADTKEFEFHTVHTGVHTDEDLLTYFDVLRDRYSGPPLSLTLDMLPSVSMLEVGDTVKVKLDQILDFNSGTPLNRTFEIQQVNTNWMTGAIRLNLFGSSQKAGTLSRNTLSSVLLDSFYTQAGVNLSTVLTIVAGVVTVSGTITGHATDIDNATAIYYYDGNLEIKAGVTVSITENIQLRIKGHLTVNGDIKGIGTGATGGLATTLYKNGSTVTSNGGYGGIWSTIDYNYGEQGYFGIPVASKAMWGSYYQGTLPPHLNTTPSLQKFDYIEPNILISAVPFYRLSNDQQSNSITGYPKDLRGNAGAGGVPYIHGFECGSFCFTYNLLGTGGAGGNGGAGLLIISRGMSFGLAGFVDLTGGDSSIGGFYTQSTGSKFYGGAGAAGAGGALVIFMDGNHTNPDITNDKFRSKYGDQPSPSGHVWSLAEYIRLFRYSPNISQLSAYGDAVPGDGMTENTDMFAAAHRLQYIPEDETPFEEVIQRPADVTGFSAVQNGDVVVFTWNSVPDIFNAGFEIRYAPQSAATFESATPLTEVTKGTSITSAAVPPGDWTFYIVGVNDAQNKYSEIPATSNLTVTNALDIISQIAQAPSWPGTLVNFVLHHTGVLVPKSQNLASADGYDTFDIFVINPFQTCTYESAEMDIGFDDDVRVWGDIQSTLGPGETGLAAPKLSIDYRLAAGSYDGFESWTIGNLTARYFKHKLTLDSLVGVAYINEFLPTVDVLEHTLSATGVTIAAAGGTTITFATPFHTVPFVRTFMAATTALIPVRSNVTATSFLAQVFNSSGADVGGTIDWEATGS